MVINILFSKALLIMFILLISCNQNQQTDSIKDDNYKSQLDWIVGNWKRTNDEVDKKTFENWKKKSNTEFIGEGFTLAYNDTIFKEQLRIIKIYDSWQLEVTGVNEFATIFEFTNISEDSFICENMLNEFPKSIEYSFVKDILTAIISDDKNEIIFSFEKIK